MSSTIKVYHDKELVKVTLETYNGTTWTTSVNANASINELVQYFFAETGFNKYDCDPIELVKTITISKD